MVIDKIKKINPIEEDEKNVKASDMLVYVLIVVNILEYQLEEESSKS